MVYFAYGSNLNKAMMMARCPGSKCLGTVMLKGWRLAFRNYLTIEECQGEQVPIGVWEVQDRDIRYLDDYEGYPELYRKEKMTIGNYEGFIYIMNEKKIPYFPPTQDYLLICAMGYGDFCMDKKYLTEALKRAFIEYERRYKK